MKKCLLLVLAFVMAAALNSVSFAGIAGSPHDVVAWTGATNYTRINTGVCSYCHIPHSAKGDRLFPTNIGDSAAVSKSSLGVVAYLCAQCHSGLDSDFLRAHIDQPNEIIFEAVRLASSRASNDTSAYDSHPTIYSSAYLAVNSQGIPDSTETTTISAKWPYMTEWEEGKRDIECTSCHNPHDWNQSNRRNYLRISYFDSLATERDTATMTIEDSRNICSYCHTGRDKSGIGVNNPGTHPVGNRVADPDDFTMGTAYVGIWFDTLSADSSDTSQNQRFFKQYYNTTGGPTNKSGLAVGDRGAHLGPAGEFTCMSCHIPHGAPNSRDGVVDLSGSYTDSTGGLMAGPLLIKNNDIYGTDAVSGFASQGPGSHFLGETAFALNVGGESNLCEWCHGLTPKKLDTYETTDTLYIMEKYAHPVNNYPTITSDNTTRAYISNLATEKYATPTIGLKIRYPVNATATAIPWDNYEESGSANVHDMGGSRVAGAASLVCMSCHDAHFAQAGTPILRGPSSVEYCEDCHYTNPLPAGASHPLKNMVAGQNCDLTTEDGGVLPNYALLYLETANALGQGGEMICRTCHGGKFGDGVIHGGMGRFMLTDFIDFAEICVNCHGLDTHASLPAGYGTARLAALRVGTAAEKSANPSYFYREGPTPVFPDGVDSTTAQLLDRVGSHYIGQISGSRLWTGDATYGWLGSSDTTLDHQGWIENTVDVSKWLDTTWYAPVASGIRRLWTTDPDSVGVEQYSIVGYIDGDETKPVITCLSCHTPHGAASGDAGNGPVDSTSESTDWDGELLLAKNKGSYICWTCHLPAATHPVDDPRPTHDGHLVYQVTEPEYNPKNPLNLHEWVTRTDTTINIFDTADPKKVVREPDSIYLPANYPYETATKKVFCESCHAAHNANSRWGSYILEGDTTIAVAETSNAWNPAHQTTGVDVGRHNKRPMADHTQHDTVKAVNDRPTCEMCHPQGTE